MGSIKWDTHSHKRSVARGISPLISTVLIISIAVILSAILLSWSSSLTKGQQTVVSNRSSQVAGCVDINIEDVYLDFSSNKSSVYVRSIGNTNIISAELINKNGARAAINTTLPMSISAGGISVIMFNINGTVPACSNFSQVLVATDCISDRFVSNPRGC